MDVNHFVRLGVPMVTVFVYAPDGLAAGAFLHIDGGRMADDGTTWPVEWSRPSTGVPLYATSFTITLGTDIAPASAPIIFDFIRWAGSPDVLANVWLYGPDRTQLASRVLG